MPWTNHNRWCQILTATVQCLGLYVAVLWTGAQSQITPVNLGCTFADNEHVYNVHLAPGEHDMPCPDSEAVKQHLKVCALKNISTLVHFLSCSMFGNFFPFCACCFFGDLVAQI